MTEKNLETLAAVCAVCGPIVMRTHGGRYRCPTAVTEKSRRQESTREPRDRSKRYPWRRAVKDRLELGKCERCPYVAEDLCQLDVDHIIRRTEGGSDDPENLVVLCANCHRLKTRLESLGTLDFKKFMGWA